MFQKSRAFPSVSFSAFCLQIKMQLSTVPPPCLSSVIMGSNPLKLQASNPLPAIRCLDNGIFPQQLKGTKMEGDVAM